MKIFYSLLLILLISGCQSTAQQHQTLLPSPLAVFKHEKIWLATHIPASQNQHLIAQFNHKLEKRLSLYGAKNIQTLTDSNLPNTGLVINSAIVSKGGLPVYQMTIYRRQRELIAESYPANIADSDEKAINQFLASIHYKIATANQLF